MRLLNHLLSHYILVLSNRLQFNTLQRRFINFSCEGPVERRFLRIGGAYIGYMLLMNILYPLIKSSFAPQIANFLNFFMFPFFVILIVPAIIKFFQNRNKDVYETVSQTLFYFFSKNADFQNLPYDFSLKLDIFTSKLIFYF